MNANREAHDRAVRRQIDLFAAWLALMATVGGILEREALYWIRIDFLAWLLTVGERGVGRYTIADVLAGRLKISAVLATWDAFLAQVDARLTQAIAHMLATQSATLGQLAVDEAAWSAGMLRGSLPIDLGVKDITAETARLAAEAAKIEGALPAQVLNKIADDLREAIHDAVVEGASQGLSLEEIAAKIIGRDAAAAAAAAGRLPTPATAPVTPVTPSAFAKAQRDTRAAVRTTASEIVNQARQAVFSANAHLLNGWWFCAILDAVTTLICRGLHGTRWPIGKGPFPPRHWQCRSHCEPWFKTAEELGLSDAPQWVKDALAGDIPSGEGFDAWFARQSEATQRRILGPGKFALFQSGQVPATGFVENNSRVLTLDELRALSG